ncbi:hypothetical protein DYI21_15005 [Thalassospira tepidiphila]|jgi:hypothetical protein|uniref:hypothetical protein n=1 Tax=Thalassospira tepidiphila TaxID=393657 RepID=UPI001BCB3F8F|nr:hypothetical protein [Thalassospira tepidiphila]MBS8274898.1 hypothetical protein [Thalassospira tepidiphila]
MFEKSFPMFPSNAQLIGLRDVLSIAPVGKFNWCVLSFYGIGKAPDKLSMEEFEAKIAKSSNGYSFTWEALLKFSEGLEQTFDCLIVGVGRNVAIDRKRVLNGDYTSCEVVIDAFDSSEWKIYSQQPIARANMI